MSSLVHQAALFYDMETGYDPRLELGHLEPLVLSALPRETDADTSKHLLRASRHLREDSGAQGSCGFPVDPELLARLFGDANLDDVGFCGG
mmetsp:Transcript_29277/g.90568  ORF Transcript_29277/g.90568 Transcript_29277/m.90568 type:complete len:91 (+) Transcript_29277:601-873(+)